jgi:hypothetical protein
MIPFEYRCNLVAKNKSFVSVALNPTFLIFIDGQNWSKIRATLAEMEDGNDSGPVRKSNSHDCGTI